MHSQAARNVGEGTVVEKVSREHVAVFGGESGQGSVDGGFHARIDRENRLGLRAGELGAFFTFFFQADEAAGAAVTVDVLLRHDRAQPAFEGAASGVGRQFRNSFSGAQAGSVQVGVERVGKFAGGGRLLGDVARHFIK